MYEATWESVSTHPLPGWYEDAKLGVFLHWGLYSVPGWAPQVPDIQELLVTRGPRAMLHDNPYAEWYRNSMQLEGSPTWHHHRQTYGVDFPYDGFVQPFDDESAEADLDALARFCRQAGAGYVVLTTKHHDGFTLWPSAVEHPVKGRYHARRDLVGDLAASVRAAGLRMGLYYSGGYDWPFNGAVLARAADAVLAVPAGSAYRAYVTGHVRELIDRYRPSVLWNDIGWPAGGNLAELFAHYYNTVDDGVVNDRWRESALPRGRLTDGLVRVAGDVVQRLWPVIPDGQKVLTFPTSRHFDVRTPEYVALDHIATRKWESTRGVGHSFGANRNERPEDIVTTTELVWSFVDIVSKNGNLLIGVGPRPDGVVPDEQQAPLRGLGRWLEVNGDAIFGSRPWAAAETTTSEGTPVRFTRRHEEVYAVLLGLPGTTRFRVRGADAAGVTRARLLGVDEPLHWRVLDDELEITLPERLPVSPAYTLSLGAGLRAGRLRAPGKGS